MHRYIVHSYSNFDKWMRVPEANLGGKRVEGWQYLLNQTIKELPILGLGLFNYE